MTEGNPHCYCPLGLQNEGLRIWYRLHVTSTEVSFSKHLDVGGTKPTKGGGGHPTRMSEYLFPFKALISKIFFFPGGETRLKTQPPSEMNLRPDGKGARCSGRRGPGGGPGLASCPLPRARCRAKARTRPWTRRRCCTQTCAGGRPGPPGPARGAPAAPAGA